MNVKEKKIRFIPRTDDPDNPVDRMRCLNVIQGLKAKGYDVGLYQSGDTMDVLVTLSLDFTRWSDLYDECFHSDIPVILDLAENEFERSAKLTRKKTLHFIGDLLDARRTLGKIRGFFKRKQFDQGFYPFVEKCSAIVGCSRIIVRDARSHVRQGYFIPDAVDQNNYSAKKEYVEKEQCTIGWVGMASGLPFLLPINRTLQRLQRRYGVNIHLITSSNYESISPSTTSQFTFHFEFVEWSLDSVSQNLASCDIGIAPLPHDSYKSSNKVITYWSVGLPVVASPTYEYSQIIVHGENGFIAQSKKEWETLLEKLLLDEKLRQKLGLGGLEASGRYGTIDKVTEQWTQVLSEVLQRK